MVEGLLLLLLLLLGRVGGVGRDDHLPAAALLLCLGVSDLAGQT